MADRNREFVPDNKSLVRERVLLSCVCGDLSVLVTLCRFLSPPDGVDHEPPTLKAAIDPSARYIVLSDKLHMVSTQCVCVCLSLSP